MEVDRLAGCACFCKNETMSQDNNGLRSLGICLVDKEIGGKNTDRARDVIVINLLLSESQHKDMARTAKGEIKWLHCLKRSSWQFLLLLTEFVRPLSTSFYLLFAICILSGRIF
jgi:hypothetical protein